MRLLGGGKRGSVEPAVLLQKTKRAAASAACAVCKRKINLQPRMLDTPKPAAVQQAGGGGGWDELPSLLYGFTGETSAQSFPGRTEQLRYAGRASKDAPSVRGNGISSLKIRELSQHTPADDHALWA